MSDEMKLADTIDKAGREPLDPADATWIALALTWKATGELRLVLPGLMLLGELDLAPVHPAARKAGRYLLESIKSLSQTTPALPAFNVPPANA